MKKLISILLCCCLVISFAFVFCPTISAAESWLWPAEDCYIVSSNYGLRDLYGTGEFNNYHYGIDIIGSTTYGMPVRAAKSGTIYEACNTIADDTFVSNSCGNYVAINHGDGTYSIYMHMRPNGVKTSGTVKQGETIGYIGNTGESYGAHLHFQIYTNPSNRNGSTLNPMPTNSNIRIQNEYVLPSGWASAKTTYSFEAGSITPPVEIVKTVNCKRTVQLPARVINLYWNPTDTTRETYFDYGPLTTCPTYAEMSDGSVWYKVNVNHQGQSTQMWFKYESDMTVTKIHTYGAVQYEYDHPHYAYQVCACGQIGYTGECGTRSDCAKCSAASITPSVTSVSLVVPDNASKQINFTLSGNLPSKYELQCDCSDIPDLRYSWHGNSLTITAYKACSGTLKVDLVDTFDYRVLDSISISVTATAQERICYFDADGGYNAPNPVKGYYGESMTIPLQEPVRDGYAFIGWSPFQDSSFAEYYPGDIMDTWPIGTNTRTLYAVWAKLSDLSGQCGEHVHWDFDTASGTLTLTGWGEMENYDYGWQTGFPEFIPYTPWRNYYDIIRTVVISDGITSIGSAAFLECNNLTSVSIPESVTSIGALAFGNCYALASITLPHSLTSIGGSAFYGCSKLKDVYYHGTSAEWSKITISSGNTKLTGATIHYLVLSGTCGDNLTWTLDTVTGVLTISGNGDMKEYTSNLNVPWAYYNDSVSSVAIEPGVTSISHGAFYLFSNITNVSIANTVTKIGSNAFGLCSGLTNISIPDSVTTIEHYAFQGCTELTEVHISDLDAWCNITFGSYDANPLYYAHDLYLNDALVTDLVIPDSVTDIGYCAFYNCTGLTSVDIPDSVTKIGSYAFYNCTGLTNITLPDEITDISLSAFNNTGCYNDKSNWKDNILYIDNHIVSIGSVSGACSIKEGTTYIPKEAFSYNTHLTSITIPESVTSIGLMAFYECRGLTSVTLSNSVTEIGRSSFYGCQSLTDIYFYGTEAEWNAIKIDEDNDALKNATVHYMHVHNYVDVVTEPTCMTQGYTTHTCSCGDTYVDSYTDALGHDIIIDETVYPTCTQTGLTEGVHCYRCDYAIAQTVIPALDHSFVGGVCTRCGEDDPNYNPPTPTDPCEGYTDINRNGWYHSAADFVISRGIMGSTKTNALTFEPNTACTRSMIVSILYRLSGSPAVTYEAKFPDVKAGQWYSDAVIWAYQNGIVSGYSDGKFGPNDKITREQMAVILKGYADFKGIDTSKIADLSDFPDANKVTWSKAAVRWAVAEGLISGKSNNGKTILDPQGNATRAEVASILMRFIENILEA